ncbi:hypothetical protein FOCC_FOCC002056 [Frankliniella occidentalis]|nr:hypothetical protein FOCC_FOCC002056 [Frankliniella occidentalis]
MYARFTRTGGVGWEVLGGREQTRVRDRLTKSTSLALKFQLMICKVNRDGVPARYVLCLMLFLGFMVTFLLRANLTIAIVAMVKEPARAEEPGGGAAMCGGQPRPAVTSSNETVTRVCANGPRPPAAPPATSSPTTTSTTTNTYLSLLQLEPQGEFEWGELQQSVILSAFFWGYVVFQVYINFNSRHLTSSGANFNREHLLHVFDIKIT